MRAMRVLLTGLCGRPTSNKNGWEPLGLQHSHLQSKINTCHLPPSKSDIQSYAYLSHDSFLNGGQHLQSPLCLTNPCSFVITFLGSNSPPPCKAVPHCPPDVDCLRCLPYTSCHCPIWTGKPLEKVKCQH